MKEYTVKELNYIHDVQIKCNNCTYEIDEASNQGFCDNCERVYQLGRESK
jgi:hypothetical protein